MLDLQYPQKEVGLPLTSEFHHLPQIGRKLCVLAYQCTQAVSSEITPTLTQNMVIVGIERPLAPKIHTTLHCGRE